MGKEKKDKMMVLQMKTDGGRGSTQIGDGHYSSIFLLLHFLTKPSATDNDSTTNHNSSGGDKITNSKDLNDNGKEGCSPVAVVLKVDFHCDHCTEHDD